MFLLALLPLATTVFSLRLAIMQTGGNSSSLCTQAITMAVANGDCTTEAIQLEYRDSCVPDKPVMGTINAAEMFFKTGVNGYIGPNCVDEINELGRLTYFWKRPIYSRTLRSKQMIDVEMYPTVIDVSLTSAQGFAKALTALYTIIDCNQSITNITLAGPQARSGDHYSLAQAVFDYLQIDALMQVGVFITFNEFKAISPEEDSKIQTLGSKFFAIAIDFASEDALAQIDLKSLRDKGYITVLLSLQPVQFFSKRTRSLIRDGHAFVIAPSIDKYNVSLADYNDGLFGDKYGDKLSYFLSCYGYCYGTKKGTTGDTQNMASIFKQKQINTAYGRFSFDASGSLLTDYSVYYQPDTDALVAVVQLTSSSLSSCQGTPYPYSCFILSVTNQSEVAPNFWKDVCLREKALCTWTNSCGSNWWLIGILVFLAILIVFIFVMVKYKRNASLHTYRMSWKLTAPDVKIIEHKASKNRPGVGEDGGKAGISNKRRAITSYALIGNNGQKAEFLQMKIKEQTKWQATDTAVFVNLKQLSHDNISKFIGIYSNEQLQIFYIMHALCERATLEEFIRDPDFDMQATFLSGFLRDITKGLSFLHRASVQHHGLLTAAHCLIDTNWVLKLSNFGIVNLLNRLIKQGTLAVFEPIPLNFYQNFSPESMSEIDLGKNFPMGTPESDIYSFGIVVYQMTHRTDPFDQITLGLPQKDIITQIIAKTLAPAPDRSCTDDSLVELMKRCLQMNPKDRPKVKELSKMVSAAFGADQGNLVDQMVRMNEKWANQLEKSVEERTSSLKQAEEQAMRLLNEMLPTSIAQVLRSGGTVLPRSYESVTVLFVQVCDFQTIINNSSPEQLIQFLNGIYDVFDTIIKKYDAYKVETTGETYMVASGVPNENNGRHITEIAEISLEIRDASYTYKVEHLPDFLVRVKIGFHCGPIAAGVIGIRSPRYCLFGDTVNFSSRMQSNCPPNQIQTSEVTALKLMEASKEYKLVQRGIVHVKGKGAVNCYWLNEHIHIEPPPTASGALGRRMTTAGRPITNAGNAVADPVNGVTKLQLRRPSVIIQHKESDSS